MSESGKSTAFRIDPARNPILANLPERAASELIAKGVRRQYPAGATMIREGDESDCLLFLIEGDVAIFKSDVEIDQQRSGGVLGEMGVLTAQKRTATVKSLTDVEVWEVGAEDLLDVLEGYPRALRMMLNTLVEKFESTQTVRVRQAANLEKATDILSRCVSPEVMEQVLNHRTPEELLDGSVEEVAILFIDIKGFSAIAETRPARQLLAALNEHLGVIIGGVSRYGGTIVNFIGDAVLAVFNTPLPVERPAVAAMNCYLRCVYELREMHARRKADDAVVFELGAGINYGSVVAGAIGSEARFSYTVLGDEVNLAARLEGLTRKYPVDVILSEACFNRLSVELSERCMLIDRVQVKGRKTPLSIYTLTDMTLEERVPFGQALQQYFRGRFANAAQAFAAQQTPLAGFFAQRCAAYAADPPEAWDGCYEWDSK